MLQFANPWFLLGLVAIAIPVIIHLFNFRRFKRVYFTNVRFIEELKLQTQKQSKLKHLLILISRILAIIMLVLAFAQPYRPLRHQLIQPNKQNAVSVYVDNSFSMEAGSAKGKLLDEACLKAGEISKAFKPSDQFQLLTTDFEGVHQRLLSRDEMQEQLAEVGYSPAARSLGQVLARQLDLLAYHPAKNLFVVSDFQKSTFNPEELAVDTAAQVFLVPVEANQAGNLFIDSCWFESPVQQLNQKSVLHVSIRNASDTDQEKIPVKLLMNNTQRAIASFDCPAGGSTEVLLSFTNQQAGKYHGRLEIVDYPVTYDDAFFFSFEVNTSIQVLCINDKDNSVFLDNLFRGDSSFQYTTTPLKSLDYSSLPAIDFLIIHEINVFPSGLLQALQAFLDKGGCLLLIPPPQLDPVAYKQVQDQFGLGSFSAPDTSNLKIKRLDINQLLYREVFDKLPGNLDLPLTLSHYPLAFTSLGAAQPILELENDDPFLLAFPRKAGTIYLFTTPLREQYTNFGKHVLFVPTLYRMALLSQPGRPLYYTIGRDEPISLSGMQRNGDDVFRISDLNGQFDFIPEIRPSGSGLTLMAHSQITSAGNYRLLDGSNEIGCLAFNYNRAESLLDFYSADELKSMVKRAGLSNVEVLDAKEKPLGLLIEELNKGVRFWKFFVLLCLLFIAAEVLMLRFWK